MGKIKMTVYGDNKHDDVEALEKWMNNEADLFFPDGTEFMGWGCGKTFLISRSIKCK